MKEYVFPEMLRKLLSDKNMSQRIFADELNTTQKSVADWVGDKSTPHIYTIMQIADYFNVTLDYLIYGEKANEVRKRV